MSNLSIPLDLNLYHFAIIVEAKNQNRGNTQAKKQLQKRLNILCPNYVKYNILEKGYKGAYAMLSIVDNFLDKLNLYNKDI